MTGEDRDKPNPYQITPDELPENVRKTLETAGLVPDPGSCHVLPDGSGFFTISLPLPADHWLFWDDGEFYLEPPPMPARLGTDDPRHEEWSDAVRDAARYAIRASTNKGKDSDFDPDAMVQNMVVGLLGYHTADGLGAEDWENPPEIPRTSLLREFPE